MRYITILLLSVAFFAAACKKESRSSAIPNGTYTGTFHRTGGPVSNVTLTFSGNDWTGQGQSAHYPSLCKGTYQANSTGNIEFENSCAWTADFDWSLYFGWRL